MKPSSILLRSCARGNQPVCDLVRKITVIYSSAVLSFSDINLKKDSDNRLPFTGTLLLLDTPSDKPPHGSEGHRILVKKAAAERALETLVGQAVNYQPEGLAAHASRHKVGVITKAWIEGNKVKVAGQIWIHDFPEARVLKGRRDLGMSMELSSVYVEDDEADIWTLQKFDFTGATILLKSAAAYTKTDLAAVAAAAKETKGATTVKHKDGKKVAAAHKESRQSDVNLALLTQAIGGTLGPAMTNAVGPLVAEIKASHASLLEGIEDLKGLHLAQLHASADTDDEEDGIVLTAAEDDASASASDEEMEAAEDDASASASASEEMEAAGGAEGDQDDSSSSASATESDMEAMEDLEIDPADQEPGQVNKDASSKGSKTTVTKPPKQGEHLRGNVAKGRLSSSASRKVRAQGKPMKKTVTTTTIQAAAMIGDLQASVRQLKRQIRAQASEHAQHTDKLRKKLSRVTAQMERFAALEGRHSHISHELVALGEKVGVDFKETQNNGQKYSTRAFDQILAAAESVGIQFNPQQRIHMKMLAAQNGILDEGAVDRGIGRA